MQEIRGLTHLHFIMIVQGQLSQTIMAVKADRTPTVRGSNSLNTFSSDNFRERYYLPLIGRRNTAFSWLGKSTDRAESLKLM